jgi:hypothetical protein
MKTPRICHGSLWMAFAVVSTFYMALLRCHQFRDLPTSLILLSSYPLNLSTSQPPNLSTSQPLNLSSYVYCTWLYCVATNSLFFFQSFKYTEMGATLSLNSSWLLFDRTSCDNTTEKIKRNGRAHLIHQRGMNEQ